VIDLFSYVFMKILEMRPSSYDQRMDKASKGRVRAVKEAVAAEVPRGNHVLEIGCGTGELAGLIIERDSTVQGFDLSPSMVKTAEKRIETNNLAGKFFVRQMGVEAMDGLPDEHFDAVVSTLVFSELNDDERRFALKHAARILKPGGRIIIADEVVPLTPVHRLIHSLVRLPLLAVTFLVSSNSTRPIDDLVGEVTEAGFLIDKEVRSHGDSFAIVIGRKRKEERTS
jgi:demethylmenaquinone methyltransferase/2-methoxy-6-polyprenyl-1,4-benzoquinol methylase